MGGTLRLFVSVLFVWQGTQDEYMGEIVRKFDKKLVIGTCAQAVLEERLVVVAGSELEAFFRSDILPSFELAFAQIAAACQALSSEVRGSCQQQVCSACASCACASF